MRKRARKRSELEPKRYTRPFAIESHRDSTFTVESSTKSCLHPYRNRCTAYNVYDSSLRSACWISSTLRKLRQMANINTLYPGSLRIHTNRLPSKSNRQPGERAAWFVWKGLGVTDPIPLIRKIRLEKAKASRHVFPSQTERRMLPPCKLSAHHPKRVAPAPGNLQGQNGLIRDPAHRDYSEQGCKLFEQIALACFCGLRHKSTRPIHQHRIDSYFTLIHSSIRCRQEYNVQTDRTLGPHGALIANKSGIRKQPDHMCAQAQAAVGFSGRKHVVHTGTPDLAARTICFLAALWQRSPKITIAQARSSSMRGIE